MTIEQYSVKLRNFAVPLHLYRKSPGSSTSDNKSDNEFIPDFQRLGHSGRYIINVSRPSKKIQKYTKYFSNYYFISQIDNRDDIFQKINTINFSEISNADLNCFYYLMGFQKIEIAQEMDLRYTFGDNNLKEYFLTVKKSINSNTFNELNDTIFITLLFPYEENEIIKFKFFNIGNSSLQQTNRYLISCHKNPGANQEISLLCPLEIEKPTNELKNKLDNFKACFSTIFNMIDLCDVENENQGSTGNDTSNNPSDAKEKSVYHGDFFDVKQNKSNLNFQRLNYTKSIIARMFNLQFRNLTSFHKLGGLLIYLFMDEKKIYLKDKNDDNLKAGNTLCNFLNITRKSQNSSQPLANLINDRQGDKKYLHISYSSSGAYIYTDNSRTEMDSILDTDLNRYPESNTSNSNTSNSNKTGKSSTETIKKPYTDYFEEPEKSSTTLKCEIKMNRYLITIEPKNFSVKDHCLAHLSIYSNMDLKFVYIDADFKMYSVFLDSQTLYIYQSDVGNTTTEDMFLIHKICEIQQLKQCSIFLDKNNKLNCSIEYNNNCKKLLSLDQNTNATTPQDDANQASSNTQDKPQLTDEYDESLVYLPIAFEINNRLFLLSNPDSLYHPARNISMLYYHIHSVFNRFFSHANHAMDLEATTILYTHVDIGYKGKIEKYFTNSTLPGIYLYSDNLDKFDSKPTCHVFFVNGLIKAGIDRYRTKCQLTASFLFAFALAIYGPLMQTRIVRFQKGVDQNYDVVTYRRLLVAAYGTLLEMREYFDIAVKSICDIASVENSDATLEKVKHFLQNLEEKNLIDPMI